MPQSTVLRLYISATAILALSACGGSGGQIASAPTPTPTPTPVATPGPEPLPARLGLASDEPFATVYATPARGTVANYEDNQSSEAPKLEFRYHAESNTYEITLPGERTGRLEPYFSNGYSTGSNTLIAGGETLPDGRVHLPVPGRSSIAYSYTSFGFWNAQDESPKLSGQTNDPGVFVYGIPTRPGDVPVSGQAGFDANVMGYVQGGPADKFAVSGSTHLLFDFGRGQLTGYMEPTVPESGWAGFNYDLGRYEFIQTVFGVGSTSYSGKFLVPNLPNADSSFSGIFTGPNAAELMGRFEAPFLSNGVSGVLVGVWAGKRD